MIKKLKNQLLPLATLLICSSWIYQVHIYLPPGSPRLAFVLYALALVILWYRSAAPSDHPSDNEPPVQTWVGLVGVGTCLISILIFPYPYNLGLYFLAAGWLSIKIFNRFKLLKSFSRAIYQFGLLLTISAALLPLINAWAARTQELFGLGRLLIPPIKILLQLLGQSVQLIDHGVVMSTFEDTLPQTLIAAKLFPVPLTLFALLWSLILIVEAKHPIKKLAAFWIIFLIYAIARTTILLLLFVQRLNPSYFWEEIPLLISIIPLGFLIGGSREDSNLTRKDQYTSPKTGLVLGLIAGGGLILSFTFRDPGALKQGRILINEHGSDWEWTTEPMDTITYNEKTTYNYYCMAEFLKNYYTVASNNKPLSSDILRNVDVLILKIPTQPYSEQEIDAIVAFVKNGGGLWVIGDHTNVFGSSSFYNPLVSRFGYRYNYDSTHDLASGNLTLFKKPPIFAHPSVSNLPPYLFATSSSIIAPWNAEAAIIGYGMRNDHLDYSQKNFFADRNRKQLNHGFGLLMQQAGSYFGKGRLLLYTDSTTFSNFFIFIKGKPELLLGSLDWLNRSNRFTWVRMLGLLIALSALIITLLRKNWNEGFLAGALLGFALLGFITDRSARAAYQLPQPKRPVPWINFEREHSSYFLPELRLETEQDRSYLTFYVWTQRLGLVPREVAKFEDTFKEIVPAIMVDLKQPLNQGELETVRNYLQRGGRLLYLHSSDNNSAAPSDFLSSFGINLQTQLAASDTLHSFTVTGRFITLRNGGKFASLSGGDPILKSDQGEVFALKKQVGKGKIVVISCGQIFNNHIFGQTTVIPDEGLKGLYRVEYQLLEEINND